MEFLTAGLQILGLGMSIFGGSESASASKEAYNKLSNLQGQEYGLETQVNEQRREAMMLDSQRRQIENIRNIQRARSMAVTSATGQGAQFGSGLGGGLGQVSGQGNWNALGIDQNTQIGQNIFGLNDKISGIKMQEAQIKNQLAASQSSAQGMSSLGGAMMKAGPMIGSFGSSLGSFGSGLSGAFSLMSGGPSGYGN